AVTCIERCAERQSGIVPWFHEALRNGDVLERQAASFTEKRTAARCPAFAKRADVGQATVRDIFSQGAIGEKNDAAIIDGAATASPAEAELIERINGSSGHGTIEHQRRFAHFDRTCPIAQGAAVAVGAKITLQIRS